MTQSSPSVARTVAILDFFSDHPNQPFTLSQVVRSLKMSRATCHAILTGLVEGGYLYRNNDKSYVLGPSLLAIARAAASAFSPLTIARPEMRALSDELDVVVSALGLSGDRVVIRDRAASLNHLGVVPSRGGAYPPYPWANVFVANQSPGSIEAWLDKARPALAPDERREALGALAFCREHGFVVAVSSSDPTSQSHRRPEGTSPLFGHFLDGLEPDRRYQIAIVTSPVMDERDQATFALSLYGFKGWHTGAQVAEIGGRLRETCQRLSNFIAGKKSWIF